MDCFSIYLVYYAVSVIVYHLGKGQKVRNFFGDYYVLVMLLQCLIWFLTIDYLSLHLSL